MTDITAFLAARLDECEAAAEAAQAVDPGPWAVVAVPSKPYREAEAGNRSGHGAAVVVAADGTELWDTHDSDYGDDQHAMSVPTAQHIARHDPARVLAEAAAKRRQLERYVEQRAIVENIDNNPDKFSRKQAHVACGVLAALEFSVRLDAETHADHPDYNSAWSVDS